MAAGRKTLRARPAQRLRRARGAGGGLGALWRRPVRRSCLALTCAPAAASWMARPARCEEARGGPADARFACPRSFPPPLVQEYFLSVLSQPRDAPGSAAGSFDSRCAAGGAPGAPRPKSFAKRWLSRQALSKASQLRGRPVPHHTFGVAWHRSRERLALGSSPAPPLPPLACRAWLRCTRCRAWPPAPSAAVPPPLPGGHRTPAASAASPTRCWQRGASCLTPRRWLPSRRKSQTARRQPR